MTPEELQAIANRVKATTRGPWLPDPRIESWITQSRRRYGVFVRHYQPNGPLNHVAFVDARKPGQPNGSLNPLEDATFMAHAREDVPALLAEVERLNAKLKAWEAYRAFIEDIIQSHGLQIELPPG